MTDWYETELWNESRWWRWIVGGLLVTVVATTLAGLTGQVAFLGVNPVAILATLYAFDKDYQTFAPAVGWDVRPFLYYLAFFFFPPFGQLIYLYNRYRQFRSGRSDAPGDESDPREVYARYMDLLYDGAFESATALVHPEGRVPDATAMAEDVKAGMVEADVEILSATVVEQTRGQAVVEAELRSTAFDTSSVGVERAELRMHDGDWRLWEVLDSDSAHVG